MTPVYTLRDIVLYIVDRLGSVEGLKKLMKLIFLTQYDKSRLLIKRSVVKYVYEGEPITRTSFYIWWYGPFSNEVYKIIDEYSENGVIELSEDEYGRTIIKPGPRLKMLKIDIPSPVRERIDKVLEKYGSKTGTELELYVLKNLLFMERPEYKEDWYGVPVEEYYKKQGIKVEIQELSRN